MTDTPRERGQRIDPKLTKHSPECDRFNNHSDGEHDFVEGPYHCQCHVAPTKALLAELDRLTARLAERETGLRNPERVRRLARSFAQEWLRPDAPDKATEQLVTTLTTTMTAFYAAARAADERDAALASPHTPEPTT